MDERRVPTWVSIPVALLSLALVVHAVPAAGLFTQPDSLRQKAQECEKKGQWVRACGLYEQILKTDRHAADAREHFQLCLRHVNQERRHRDPGFLKAVAARPFAQALDAYEEVLLRLQANYVERDKISLTSLFQHGLTELRYALDDDAFLRRYLPNVPADKVRAFARRLEGWSVPDLPKPHEAREQARAVAMAGLEDLGLSPTASLVELAWGAGNGLDEYTVLLTPSQLSALQASWRGETVGVGLRLASADGKLFILSVIANSPAEERGLRPNDRVTRIDGQATDGWSEEQASARLLGRAGTAVDLEVTGGAAEPPHTVHLVRQPLLVPSVEWEPVPRDGVGYVRIVAFQDGTVQELKDALLHLQAARMKALVLDLRGNSGGLFQAAVQVAELFLSDGVIVFTESPLKRFRGSYRAHNANALTLPLVVLVDGETASAAEVLAGALKDNGRATLVGAPTYGKGSIQCPVPLENLPAGIWITVARFYSPARQPYSDRGVTPHVLEEVDVMGSQRTAAWRAAQQLVLMAR
ncbi:MAG TPA: S41 family peptidase [Gemmataceae bacterium]|nr:S41 family peptidase [Gemmataceae bacterium]